MLITGDSVIVETDYPGCILDRDKVRLYSQSANSLARPQYIGEQRVIQVSRAKIVNQRGKTNFLFYPKVVLY